MLKRVFLLLAMIFPLSFKALYAADALDKVVAIVNENVITATELDAHANAMRNQIQAKNMQLPPDHVLKKQVLQHLVDVDLQLQLAKNNNISIDDSELSDAMAKIAASNKLTMTQLRKEIEKKGLSWKEYRDNIRKEMIIARVQQHAVGKNIVVSAQHIDDYMKTAQKRKKQQQVYHLKNIVIPLPEEPTTEQLKKAKKKARDLLAKIKSGEDFSQIAIAESSGEYALEGGDLGKRHLAELPEIFADKVVTMEVGEVAGPIRAGNGYHLIKLVTTGENQAQHKVHKTHVRHILIKPDANMTADEAKKQVDNIYQHLKSGKDFAAMAKQYSLDRASAKKGGDLGWVTSEELVSEFSEVMNKLPLRSVSTPVKSPFGWHLIEVMERKTVDDSKAFERQQVRQYLYQRKFGEAVQNWLQHMRSSAYVDVVDKELA